MRNMTAIAQAVILAHRFSPRGPPPMADAETLLCARWVLPMSAGCPVIEQGAVAFANGRILEVGAAEQLRRKYPQAGSETLPDHLLMPGLVNAHGHAAMSLLRGAGEDMALEDWLNTRIWPLERTLVSPEFVQDGVALACAEQIRGGITCFADNYFYPEHMAALVQRIGLRAQLACPIIDFAMPGCPSPKEAIAKVLKLHDDRRAWPLISIAFGPHAPYTVSDEWLHPIATYAQELGLQIHMHVHESEQEIADSLQRYGVRPLERLARLGLLGPQFVAVHAVHLNDDDIALLKAQQVSVVHCPESNLKLASGMAPIARLREAGINVALGTDGAASNNDLDLWGEARTAAYLGKALARDPRAMKAEDLLQMLTLGGARALGLEQEIGSLECGKAADLIAIDLSALMLQPIFNPIHTLIYGLHREQVSDVWVAGQALMRHRELLSIDETTLRAKVARWQQDIQNTLSGKSA
jgi:5-methylthioadenosine/S-adenosylhomocysteine deaminase